MSRHAPLTRSDVAAFAQMVLAARVGAYTTGHGQGTTDAAFGQFYAHGRTASADSADYDLGYRVGRFILFEKLPAWRAGMLTHTDAAEWWAKFRASAEGRPDDPA